MKEHCIKALTLQQVRDGFLSEFSTVFEVELEEGQLLLGELKHDS